MTQPDLVLAIRKKFGLTIPVAEQMAAWFFDTIADQIVSGGSVVIKGFGAFHPRHHPPRAYLNPKTGVPGVSAAKTSLHFSPSSVLLERLKAAPAPSTNRSTTSC